MKTFATLSLSLCVAFLIGLPAPAAAAKATPPPPVSFLVIAPDRGFLGNEEVRDVFVRFAEDHAARLVFATDERTREGLTAALAEVGAAGPTTVVVLPLFVAPSSPRLAMVRRQVEELRTPGAEVHWARPYGATYLAVEALAERLHAVLEPAPAHGTGHGGAHSDQGRTLVVVGSGARDETSLEALRADWRRLGLWAAEGLGISSVEVAVAPDGGIDDPEERRELEERFESDLSRVAAGGALVVPFHQGMKLDGMMSLDAALPRMLPEGAELAAGAATPDPTVGLWMEREANRHLARAAGDLGVIALAHGSDYHWNETIRRALAPLGGRYVVEPTFSMADPALVERAIRALERRGICAAVVVRIFGLESSFRGGVERMLGLDVESPDGTLAEPPTGGRAGHYHGGHGGHGHGTAPPPRRIRTALVTSTVGGLEDHPLFARALYERALEISEEPTRETLVLTAHGRGEDDANAHWQEVLASLARQIRKLGGDRFRSVETVTWREDWPGKREPEIERARRLVAEAAAGGGRALVIPARTNGEGPERELLGDLEFRVGTGFAPHPLFAEWVHAMVREGLGTMALESDARTGLLASLDGEPGSGPTRTSASSAWTAPQGPGSPEEP